MIYVLIAAVAIYVLMHFFYSEQGETTADVLVQVQTVQQKNVDVRLQTIGTVQAYASVAIKSMVTGPLVRAGFKEGDIVEKDQVLFEIDQRSFIAALDEARANLLRDQATLANNRAQLDRNRKLVARGYVAKQDFETLAATVSSSAATVAADEAAIKNAELQLAYATIRAPFSGKTGNITLKPGSVIKANDTDALVTINQINPIYVTFSVPQHYLTAIQQNLRRGPIHVKAIISQKQIETGQVSFINNTVDTATGTIELKATFANHERYLWPGQFVTIELPVEHMENAIVVPSLAIMTGQQGFYVYVIDQNHIAHMRLVKTGPVIEKNETIIFEGLKAGEQVVTSGQLRLQDGIKVNIHAEK